MRSLFFGEISHDQVILQGSEGHHAADVLRLTSGEEIEVSDNRGHCAVVRVDTVAKGQITGTVLARREITTPAPRIIVGLALLKGEAMTDAVDLLTQVGVHSILPWSAERSIAQWRGERADKSLERLRSAAFAAAKQSRNPLVPEVAPVHDTDQLLRAAQGGQLVVLHEGAREPLGALSWQGISQVMVVVGPEGGISPGELARFSQFGARTCRLGPTVIRAAQAGAVATALIQGSTAWRLVSD